MSDIKKDLFLICYESFRRTKDTAEIELDLPDQIISYLKSQNVVRKVDRGLPKVTIDQFNNPIHPHLAGMDMARFIDGMEYLSKQGYVAVRDLE